MKKSERFLVCIADRLTPKMRHSLKAEVGKSKLSAIKKICREKDLAFDIIPINATNFGRLAVVMDQVRSIEG